MRNQRCVVRPNRTFRGGLILVLVCLISAEVTLAQKPNARLPSVNKIIDQHLKASGGKKKLAAIADAEYLWTVEANGEKVGTARLLRKYPASERWEITTTKDQIIVATNSSSAWQSKNNQLRTLTGLEAAAAKLKAALDSSRLVNLKKSNVLARVTGASGPSYLVEFSTRGRARVRYDFASDSGLITKVSDGIG